MGNVARIAAAAGSVLACLAPVTASADEPAPPPELLKAAAEEFDRGRRAFLGKDFEQAAVHFESAYRDAPRGETLRLAIRARREAKQLSRAATLAAIAEERYGADPATGQLARETLDEATPLLQEYVVVCATDCTVAADGRVVSQADARRQRIYLEPGPHELGVSFRQGTSLARHVESKKAAKETLAFEPPAVVTPPRLDPPKPTPSAEEPPPSPKPFGPLVFIVGAGITAGLGAASIWSGLDTQNSPGPDAVRAQCAGRDASCPAYAEGQDKETRTNILIGTTIGAAVLTGIVGIFFTQWSSSPKKAGLRVSPTVSF